MNPSIVVAALAAIVFLGSVLLDTQPASAQAVIPAGKPDIVLVHGAFADGSSWSKVILLLEAKGYHVVAVQNPYISLAGDVMTTDSVVNQQSGPVVLVGHSSGGTVITQAGNNPKVAALVYVSANAPDSGQSINDLQANLPAPAWASTLIKDEEGYLTLPDSTIVNDFAPDLTPAEQSLIEATQVPWYSGYLDDKVTHAAWHDKPSWWVIGERDRMIDPNFQTTMATRMGAKIIRLPSSHVVMLSDPEGLTDVIVSAAQWVQSHGVANASGTSGAGTVVQGDNTSVASPSNSNGPETIRSARDVEGPAALIALSSEAPAKLVVDPPLVDSLAHGRVVIQYRAENVRIEPVFGSAALKVSPRVGHIHVTVDDAQWHWLDTSGQPITITGLPAGPHNILVELVNAAHQTLDYADVKFVIPYRYITPNDPKADGFREAPATYR